jgi:hypothetical protein
MRGLLRCQGLAVLAVAIALPLAACTAAPDPAPVESGSSAAQISGGSTVSSAPATSERSKPTAKASTSSSGAPTSSAVSSSSPACVGPAGFDCDFKVRIAAVTGYLATRPGTVGIVLRDRSTGAIWRNQYAATPVWTASTIKLAMAVDLLRRHRTGQLTLSAADRVTMNAMLHSSDDDAADTLWFKYAGANHLSYNDEFPAFGMTTLVPQPGFTNYFPYWGFQKCTPDDLDRLMHYVLTTVNPIDRAYLISELQHVAPDQQWGVWASDQGASAGSKDGWSLEQGGWVMNSIGFAGPGQRYTLAIMNSLNGQGGYDDGRATDTRVAQLLLTGR